MHAWTGSRTIGFKPADDGGNLGESRLQQPDRPGDPESTAPDRRAATGDRRRRTGLRLASTARSRSSRPASRSENRQTPSSQAATTQARWPSSQPRASVQASRTHERHSGARALGSRWRRHARHDGQPVWYATCRATSFAAASPSTGATGARLSSSFDRLPIARPAQPRRSGSPAMSAKVATGQTASTAEQDHQ